VTGRTAAEPPGAAWDYARLSDIARRFGTPIHVLDAARLDERAGTLLAAMRRLGRPARAYYSVKTNYLPYLCRRLARHGFGADVVSGYEMQAALQAGFPAASVIFNGPVKTADELTDAVRHGVRINIDGQHEIAALDRLAARAGYTLEVGLRLSPGVAVTTSADPSYRKQAEQTARRSRFGWPTGSPELNRVVDQIAAAHHLALTAVHAHLGSQIVHQDLMLLALDTVLGEAARLHRRFGVNEFNIGGGFGVPGIRRPRCGPLTALWTLQGGVPAPEYEPELDVAALLADVDKRMADLGFADVTLACEPGRWLVSDTMVVVTQVMSRKDVPSVQWLIVDAGNNVTPWTGTGEQHMFMPVGREFSAERSSWAVAGPLCYENDIHAAAVTLPADLGPGDLLCLHDTGAYSLGRSSNFIRPRAAVVAIDEVREELVWRAETGADVFALADPVVGAETSP
jgi:diaminopimelate decarboxylase